MTENEFRDALRQSVGSTGLSSDRQYLVLARMKGEEKQVRMHSKFRAAMVLMMVLMFSMGAAVASEIVDYVKWNGEQTQSKKTDLGDQEAIWQRMLELSDHADPESAVVVSRPSAHNSGEISSVGMLETRTMLFTEEGLQEIAADNMALYWPTEIPEGYIFRWADVYSVCQGDGMYEVVDEVQTEDQYIVTTMRIPEEHRSVSRYTACYDSAKYSLEITVHSYSGDGPRGTFMTGVDTVVPLKVVGMSDALLIKGEGRTMLAMRAPLNAPMSVRNYYFTGDYITENTGMTIEITTSDPSLTADDLLAILGLKAE